MKTGILIILCMILLSGMVISEVETLGVFKQNIPIELRQSGAGFSNCTIYSVTKPDSTITVINTLMIKNGNNYNYSFTGTSQTGKYIADGYCTEDAGDTVWNYDFQITSGGNERDNSFLGTILILMLVTGISLFVYTRISRFFGSMMIFALGFGILFTIPEYGWMGWIFIGCGFIMVVYSIMTPKRRRFR